MPDLRIAVVPHPVGHLSASELAPIIDTLAAQVSALYGESQAP